MATILIVDDEEGIRFSLRGVLEDEGHTVREASTGELGLAAIEEDRPDLVFLDIWLPGMDGLEVLEAVCKEDNSLPVIMISGHGNIETAVSAIKKGAFDFIEKPLSLEKIIITANKALKFSQLQRENLVLRSKVKTESTHKLTGQSPVIAAMREQIERVAPTNAWVLITGENGTGKEIVARSIHGQSQRKDMPMVAVNCAAIPEELIESELFGHEKGAFTGAEQAQAGKFEMAHKGTLFLDEIGDMSMKTQAKILRILQEQCFERVGGRKTMRVDVRVIAATNKDLEQEIKNGTFREDLYYRLKVFPLVVPPLRDRIEDLLLLMDEFVQSMSREHGFKPITFSAKAKAVLQAYHWPGNVRELKNFVERMLIMCGGGEVTPELLPPEYGLPTIDVADISEDGTQPRDLLSELPEDFKAARHSFETAFLEYQLQQAGGSVTRLAEIIGMERSYLYRKLKQHGIEME